MPSYLSCSNEHSTRAAHRHFRRTTASRVQEITLRGDAKANRHFVVKLLSLVLLAGTAASGQSTPARKEIPAIAKAANGAVVSIVMSDKDGNPIAQGSGFLVSRNGVIVTNYHVIAQGTSAVIKLPDGAFFIVDGLIAFDKARDLAVIKAHGEDFRRTLTLGNSDRVQVGQEVVAIGNPLSLESTVSNGIVSGIREDEALGGKFLQITTPISPGSSGGPLFSMTGEVVGITTLYLKGGENLNFAIPINDAKRLLAAKRSKIQELPNEPEAMQGQAFNENAPVLSAPTGRDYYKQLHDAGGLNDVFPSSYVCFEDTSGWREGLDAETIAAFKTTFYILTAFALPSDDQQAHIQEISEAPYVAFLPLSLLEHFVNAPTLAYLRQGGRVIGMTPYIRGVKMGTVTYFWDQDERKWWKPIETGKQSETKLVEFNFPYSRSRRGTCRRVCDTSVLVCFRSGTKTALPITMRMWRSPARAKKFQTSGEKKSQRRAGARHPKLTPVNETSVSGNEAPFGQD